MLSATAHRRVVKMGHEPYGLHMRPAAELAKCARQWSGTITLRHGELTADGTSPSELMMLMVLPGSELILEADGPDVTPKLCGNIFLFVFCMRASFEHGSA